MPETSSAISYSLEIAGAPASPELIGVIQSLQIEDHADLPDLARLRLAIAPRSDGGGWTIVDDALFSRLTEIHIMVKIGNALESLIIAYVVETRIEFATESGQSTLTVVAMDPTVLMNLDEKVKPWPDMTDSDIATAIFSDYGFTPRVEPSQPARSSTEHHVIQRGTDIQFLGDLARRNGSLCYVETSPDGVIEGHFHPSETDLAPQKTLTVNMGEATNVTTFSVRYDMLKPLTAEAKGIEIESGGDQPAESRSQSGDELGGETASPTDRPRRVLLANTGLVKSDELQTLAQAVVDRSGWAIFAEGELNAPTYGAILRAKRPVMVRGAGRHYSGEYVVERVLHTFSPEGYRQRFTLKRNALGLTGRENFREDSGS